MNPNNLLTQPEKKLTWLFRFWLLCFVSVFTLFFRFSGQFLEITNQISAKYFPGLLPIPTESNPFWMPLVFSMMIALIVISYMVQKNVRKNLNLIPVFLASKLGTSIFFFAYFFTAQKSFAFLFGSISDAFMFLITYFLYQRVKPNASK